MMVNMWRSRNLCGKLLLAHVLFTAKTLLLSHCFSQRRSINCYWRIVISGKFSKCWDCSCQGVPSHPGEEATDYGFFLFWSVIMIRYEFLGNQDIVWTSFVVFFFSAKQVRHHIIGVLVLNMVSKNFRGDLPRVAPSSFSISCQISLHAWRLRVKRDLRDL